MTAKRFTVVKCIENQWGIIDYSLEDLDQLILIHTNKTEVSIIVNELNRLNDENEQLKNICKNLINEVNKRGITVTMSDSYKELLE